MNPVDAWLCVACGGAMALTQMERNPDRDAPVAAGVISASLAVGIAARALRNAGYVETQTIYLLNPVMDLLIGFWALSAHRRAPREWTRLLILVSIASIFASAAYGYAAKTPQTKYQYAIALNALLIAGLCGIGYGGLKDGLGALGAWLRKYSVPGRLPIRGRRG